MNKYQNVPDSLQSIFAGFDDDYEYMDNLRCARLTDAEAMARYHEIYKRGCCGYFDRIYEIDGEPWLVGCNFGH